MTSVTSDVAITASMSGKINFSDAGIVINLLDGDSNIIDHLNDKTIVTDSEEAGRKADFKIGANTYSEDILSIGIGDMSAKGLNIKNDGTKFSIDISTPELANECLEAIDYAIDTLSSQRATLGAIQNRMEYAISNLAATEENLSAAESRIRDVDMADEMVKYTKNNILNQSAMAMLSQANQQPQAILTLLQ